MDFGLRDWLLILGPLFILAVLLHGYWRMRAGKNTLKMALDKSFMRDSNTSKEDDLALLRGELPSGGARPAGSSKQGKLDLKHPDAEREGKANPGIESPEIAHQESRRIAEPPIAASQVPDLDSSVPVLMEAVELGDSGFEKPDKKPVSSEVALSKKDKISRENKILALNLISGNGTINGQTLLESLVSQNLIYGEMNIFHFVDDAGDACFSLANAVEPGSFDLNTMKELETPGVTLFMNLQQLDDPDQVFDEMIKIARALAEELNCQLKDETHSVVTAQTIEHYRQTIQDYRYKNRGNA